MTQITPGINSLRNLTFVKNFGNQVIAKSDIKVKNKSGNINLKGKITKLSPQKIRYNTSNKRISVQKNKKPQDRLIDIFV